MADSRAKELRKQGDFLFQKKRTLNSLHQELADNFYVERADFTTVRTLGTDFAANLTTSYPILARRELASLISTMLRPDATPWFDMSIMRDDKLDNPGRAWLQDKTMVMKRAMYDLPAKFVRATKEGDNDFVTFGQCVLTVELNRMKNGLLYRCWHLRDNAWAENSEGDVDTNHRKWKPTARDLLRDYGRDKLHPKVLEQIDNPNKNPFEQFEVRNIVIPAEDYNTNSAPGGKNWTTKFVEITIDVANEHVIEEVGVHVNKYIVPRWQTVSGSQYSYSPATVAALPDARLIQAMTLTLLEAGEKATNPPMKAVADAVRGDISIFAGGVTWVDAEYDERSGPAIEPFKFDYSKLPFGVEMLDRTKQMMAEAFYLNKINLPPPTKEMTAMEVGERIKEYVRNAMPLFEPMEMDYNGQVCQKTFDTMLHAGGFGSRFDMPQSLQGQDVRFIFKSPLHEAEEQQKAATFVQTKNLVAEAMSIDPACAIMVDFKTALRDALQGVGTSANWLMSKQDMDKAMAQKAQDDATAKMLAQVNQGATVAEQVGKAGQAISGLTQPGQPTPVIAR